MSGGILHTCNKKPVQWIIITEQRHAHIIRTCGGEEFFLADNLCPWVSWSRLKTYHKNISNVLKLLMFIWIFLTSDGWGLGSCTWLGNLVSLTRARGGALPSKKSITQSDTERLQLENTLDNTLHLKVSISY